MIKYTLFCQNGSMFKTAEHYCYFGSWLAGSGRYTILAHGSIPDEYYQKIRARGEVPIFYNGNLKCWCIERPYCEGYSKRVEDQKRLLKFVGILVKTNKSRLYKGGLKHED